MVSVIRAKELYGFLWYCNRENLEKRVLDCGAAGRVPPLTIFNEQGYETYGIDIDEGRIRQTKQFSELNITLGDMRKLDFSNNFFSFLYSYHSIFHLSKKDTEVAIKEFKRVTQRNGLIFVDFLSIDDFLFGLGTDLGNGVFEQSEDGEKEIHSFYKDNEADYLFEGCSIIHKEKNILERYAGGRKIKQSFLNYTVRVL